MPLAAALLFCAARADADHDLVAVRLELARDAFGCPTVTVRVELPTPSIGNLDLLELSTGSSDEGQTEVRLVAARDLQGNALHLESMQDGRCAVHRPAGERYQVETRLELTRPRQDPGAGELSRAMLDGRAFFTSGSWVVALPRRLDATRTRPVRIEWIGAEELGWEVASSLGAGPGPFERRMSLRDLKTSLFFAGEFESFEYAVPGGSLVVAAACDGWDSDRREFAELARDVVSFQRSYLGDGNQAFRVVSLLPWNTDPALPPSRWGVALHDASALFSSLGGAFGGREEFALLLLHEGYHDWSPDLGLVWGDAHPYWFSEGFAEFFALRLALRGGFIGLDEYVGRLNLQLEEYGLSPERDANSTRIASEFWRDGTVRRQPYLLGHLLAARVDAAIRARSENERSLDDLMRELERDARASSGGSLNFGLEGLFERMEAWAGEPLPDVRQSAMRGTFFELPADTFAPVLELERVEYPRHPPFQRARVVDAYRYEAWVVL